MKLLRTEWLISEVGMLFGRNWLLDWTAANHSHKCVAWVFVLRVKERRRLLLCFVHGSEHARITYLGYACADENERTIETQERKIGSRGWLFLFSNFWSRCTDRKTRTGRIQHRLRNDVWCSKKHRLNVTNFFDQVLRDRIDRPVKEPSAQTRWITIRLHGINFSLYVQNTSFTSQQSAIVSRSIDAES